MNKEMLKPKTENRTSGILEGGYSIGLPTLPQERGQELLSARDETYIASGHGISKVDEINEDAEPIDTVASQASHIDCMILIKVLSTGERVLYQIQAQPSFSSVDQSLQQLNQLIDLQFEVSMVALLRTGQINQKNFSHPQPLVRIPNPVVRI